MIIENLERTLENKSKKSVDHKGLYFTDYRTNKVTQQLIRRYPEFILIMRLFSK